MAGKRRSGLANDRRAYRCTTRCPPSYTVTYYGNGSTSGAAPKDRSSPYKVGLLVRVLGNVGIPTAFPPLAKTQHAFVEWNTKADGTGVSYSQDDTFTINEDTTLYARWIRTYTVTYDNNYSTSGSAPIDELSPYIAGSTVTVLGNPGLLENTGFAFVNWNTERNGDGTSYSEDDTFTINEDTPLFAQWAPTYTVTYDDNDSTTGSVPVDTARYIAGTTVTVLGNTGSLVKTGSTFAGWNTQDDGDGTSYSIGPPPATFTINANVTLYAKWELASIPLPPTALSSVAGDQAAYILFTQSGTVTNYEYSTDDGETFVAFNPPQIYSPVNINTLSSNVLTRLTNGTPYIVRLKAVNSGLSSDTSVSVTVVPGITTLLSAGRIIYLDANNTSSYSGSGTAWTNLDPNMVLSATLNGSPTFNSTNAGNKYFEFNPGAATGQFALINQNIAINPVVNQPFTIQMWVKINNVGSQGGTLVSKMFGVSEDYDGYNLQYTSDTKLQLHLNGAGVDDNNRYSQTNVLSNGWALYTANIKFGNQSVGGSNKVFVNGREVLTFINFESGINSPTQNLTFPAGYGPEGECDIGQFYYYNTELTQTQIIQNFDATKSRYI
jgi:uncharacterized repeat protein (TIGR02543 family)